MKMKGICKPKDTGVISVSGGCRSITVGIHNNQIWEFAETGDGRILLQYRLVSMLMPRLQFEEDWEIVKSE